MLRRLSIQLQPHMQRERERERERERGRERLIIIDLIDLVTLYSSTINILFLMDLNHQ